MKSSVEMERFYHAPVEKVWDALTNAVSMKKWYFYVPAFRPEVGLEFEFTAGEDGGKQYHHACKVTQAVKNEKIAYTWRYPGYEGNSEVVFELFKEGEGTRVKLSHYGLDTFPLDHADFAEANFQAGWTFILNESLVKFLAKI